MWMEAGMMGLGMPEIVIISVVIIVLFGARKLPALGGAIGESIKNFKKGVKDLDEDKKLAGTKDKDPSEPS